MLLKQTIFPLRFVLTLPALRYSLRSDKAQALRENEKILRLPLGHGGFLLVQFPPDEWVFEKQEGHKMHTTRFHLQWKVLDKEHYALIFDNAAWTLLQDKADALGVDTCDMISDAIASLLGEITSKKVTEKD